MLCRVLLPNFQTRSEVRQKRKEKHPNMLLAYEDQRKKLFVGGKKKKKVLSFYPFFLSVPAMQFSHKCKHPSQSV